MAGGEALGGASASASVIDAAKVRGNKLVKLGSFEEACAAYTEALQHPGLDQESSIPLLTNRALAFLRLGCFTEALADCDRVLVSKPEHQKALFRRGKALSALRRFPEMLEVYAQLAVLDPQNSEVQAELKLAKVAIAQATRGEFDFRAMLAEACLKETLQLQHSKPLCEYRNEALEVIETPDRGLAYRARQEIQAGELLVMARPLVFACYSDFAQGTHQILVEKLLEANAADPESARQLIELCGARDAAPPLTGVICEETAREILRRNSAASHTGVGLWYALAFFNHGHPANVSRHFIADWGIVRATCNISAGSELLLSYIDACADYNMQLSWLLSLGIEDNDLKDRADRWQQSTEKHVVGIRSIGFNQYAPSEQWPPTEPAEGGPLEEKKHYLRLLDAHEDQPVWCWGRLVGWLRDQSALHRERSQIGKALGAALAAAALTEKNAGDGPMLLDAWADASALLMDLSAPANSDEYGEVMGLCINGLQRCVEFAFGARWADDTDFSTLVLEWATLRWYHAAAWQRQACVPSGPPPDVAEQDLGSMD
eukprot:TRINITY_DN63210_c0_g1_i1.p1 TRINITY_DN63210_c0_g1~~TRINITY_DN63210_c0_g1_i1.p1  ORF type:complete len:553 (+),score=100.86 TRINITY_DN63210_c0_g1_i1:22-1659(+)